MSRFLDRAVTALSVGLIVIGSLFLARPDSAVRAELDQWLTDRRIGRLIERDWDVLVASSARMKDDQSSVRVIEFFDYQCPYCKWSHGTLTAAVTDLPTIDIAYRHFPLPYHAAADGAARAAICAENQGRFWEMHTRLFTTDQWQADEQWMREATAAKVPDLETFAACLMDSRTTDRLTADRRVAEELGIDVTPTLVTKGGGITVGALKTPEIMALIGSH